MARVRSVPPLTLAIEYLQLRLRAKCPPQIGGHPLPVELRTSNFACMLSSITMCRKPVLVIPDLIVSEIFDMKTCLFLNGFSKFPSSGPHSSHMGRPKNFLFCMWTKHWKGYSFMMSDLPQCRQILLAASLNKIFGTEEKEVWLWKTTFCFRSILGLSQARHKYNIHPSTHFIYKCNAQKNVFFDISINWIL